MVTAPHLRFRRPIRVPAIPLGASLLIAALALPSAVGAEAPAAESPLEELPLDEAVYLIESGGHIWIEEPLVYLGMVGVQAWAPVYRLGPEQTGTLAPLVTRVESPARETETPDGEKRPVRYSFQLPRARGPIALVRLSGMARLVDAALDTRQRTYEVVSFRLLSVEFLTPEWRRAFEALDAALRDTVAASLEAPSEEKRARLSEAIAQGAAASEAMARARETKEMRRTVERIAPGARCVHAFQRRIAREWGGRLRACVEALGMEPPTSLPSGRDRCPALEILLESASPAGFLSSLRERCGEEGLEEKVYYYRERQVGGGTERRLVQVPAWEVKDASAELFEEMKEYARKALADQKAWQERRERARAAGSAGSAEANPEAWEMPSWGVKLRKADAATRAKVLVCRGTMVEAVLPGGAPLGLMEGDIILDYGGVYDLVMGESEFGSPRSLFERLSRFGGSFRAIRGERIVTIEIPKPEAPPK